MADYLCQLFFCISNTITMVVLFANAVAWLWWINSPHPWEPLWKGLSIGGVKGNYYTMQAGQEKKIANSMNLYSFFYLFASYCPQNNRIASPTCFPLVAPPLLDLLCKDHLMPSKVLMILIWIIFVASFTTPKMGRLPPTHSTPHAAPLQLPSYCDFQLLVDCCVFSLFLAI